MKTHLLTLVAFICCLNPVLCQFPDLQWLISDNLGKEGTTTSNNLNNYVNPIPHKFTVQGVRHPDLSLSPRPRNDIFIIYTDGSHFNSRYLPGSGIFYAENSTHQGDMEHNLYSTFPNGNIAYMYLTNIYEMDDLPPSVKVNSSWSGTNSSPITFDFTNPGGQLLTATHNVAYYKDITLIVNFDSIRNLHQNGIYTLRFDGVRNRNTGALSNDNILDWQPVFKDIFTYKPAFPFNVISNIISSEEVTLNINAGSYGYFNFRPNENAFNYRPGGDGEPRFDAVFTLNGPGGTTQLTEPIRHAHDPNFLSVDSICISNDGSHMVSYHLEFENVSTDPAHKLKVRVKFPSQFDTRCIRSFKWYAGGAFCRGVVERNNNVVVFNFTQNNSLRKCDITDENKCRGYVEFTVRVKPGNDLRKVINSLHLGTPTVFFDDVGFPLTEFHDLMLPPKDDFNWTRPVTNGNCPRCERVRYWTNPNRTIRQF